MPPGPPYCLELELWSQNHQHLLKGHSAAGTLFCQVRAMAQWDVQAKKPTAATPAAMSDLVVNQPVGYHPLVTLLWMS